VNAKEFFLGGKPVILRLSVGHDWQSIPPDDGSSQSGNVEKPYIFEPKGDGFQLDIHHLFTAISRCNQTTC
jgi:hypothetical protein